MADSGRKDDVRKTEFQERFKNGEGDNVMQQAGASLGEGRAPIPAPGDRLTGKQAEREVGRGPNGLEMSDASRAEVKEMEERKASKESDALREQYSGDAGSETDSNLESGKVRARVEGLIGNPD